MIEQKKPTLLEQYQNIIEQKIPPVRTIPKSNRTKNTTLLEQSQNIMKQKIPHC
jgi:hypothetical protein